MKTTPNGLCARDSRSREAVANLQTPDAGNRCRCASGVATGIVVVGDLVGQGSAQEQAVVGDTPNLAARLQALRRARRRPDRRVRRGGCLATLRV